MAAVVRRKVACCSSERSTRTTAGSTGLLGRMECLGDSLFIDHSRGLNVAAVMCSQKVGIGKDWGNDVWKLLVTSKFQNVSGISTSPVVSARIRPAAINLAMGSRA